MPSSRVNAQEMLKISIVLAKVFLMIVERFQYLGPFIYWNCK